MQISPDAPRATYARTDVEIQERLDGSIVVVHEGRTLASKPAPPEPVTLRARKGRRSNGAGAQPRPQAKPRAGSWEARPRPPLEETRTDIVIEQLP